MCLMFYGSCVGDGCSNLNPTSVDLVKNFKLKVAISVIEGNTKLFVGLC